MASGNHAVQRLQALLAERELAPGDRLPPERELAAELGVSRASLREALRRLVDLGIVQARQGSGTYLAPIDLEDLFATRLRLEPYAARLAARRRGSHHLAELEAALGALRATEADAAAFAAADARLHVVVTDASGSASLRVLLAALADLLRHSRAQTAPDAAVRAAAVVQLGRLVAAIRDGDAAGAERAMTAHLRAVARTLADGASAA